jgi:titin
MKRSRVLIFSVVGIVVLLVTVGARVVSGAPVISRQSADTTVTADVASTIVVTSTADSGPGTLRQLLLDAESGDVITFDPVVFPPTNPVTISLVSELPHMSQGNITLDGTHVGVVLDGSQIPGQYDDCLILTSDHNAVKGLRVENCPSSGIEIWGHHNTIGGPSLFSEAASGSSCTVLGCGDGVMLTGGASSNWVTGNYIGTDQTGSTNHGNGTGVFVWSGAHDNRLVGNLISGNAANGVVIEGDGTAQDIVQGNYIGTDISGTVAISNTNAGVYIADRASYNLIGGDEPGERNLISGNGRIGVSISSFATSSNTVAGNYVGVDARGMAALANVETGVWIGNDSRSNTVKGNVISGNGCNGIALGSDTVVHGNLVGTDATGESAVGNGCQGIWIGHGAQYNIIGGGTAQDRNVISGSSWGVGIEGVGTTDNVVRGNLIGTGRSRTAALGNYNAGVVFYGGSRYNTIGPANTIAHNGTAGVVLHGSDCMSDTITRNSIHDNSGLGVELVDGANMELPAPDIVNVTVDLVNGSTVIGTACSNCTVEVFTDDEDEGRIYWGSTIADAAGDFIFVSNLHGAYLTSTATDAAGNTSEFSSPLSFTPRRLYLPLLTKS